MMMMMMMIMTPTTVIILSAAKLSQIAKRDVDDVVPDPQSNSNIIYYVLF